LCDEDDEDNGVRTKERICRSAPQVDRAHCRIHKATFPYWTLPFK